MFSLTVIDHVRLDSVQAARNYDVHARSAERIVRLVFTCRIAITALLAAATSTAIANLLFQEHTHQIATVATSALALIAFAVYAVFGLEARLFAHRSLAHRLWLIS